MAAAQTFAIHAEPIVRESAAKWRYAVDNHIAPGVVALGKGAAQGVATGVDMLAESVLDRETKAKLDESVGALGTIAEVMIGSGEEDNYDYIDEESQYRYQTNFDPSPQYDSYTQHQEQQYYPDSNFYYQQLDPTDYDPSILQPPPPPGMEPPSSTFQRRTEHVVPSNVDPRHYQTNFHTNQNDPSSQSKLEEALYVLGKNILGQNVTDRLFPVAKQMADGFGMVGDGLATITGAIPLPTVEFDESGIRLKTVEQPDENDRNKRNNEPRITTAPKCTTPRSGSGKCMDIQNCPLLLADLDNLRKSICFKSLFVPGVCCPDNG